MRLSCFNSMQGNHEGLVQGDRWEEGRDPELFNARRRTSRDEAASSAQPPAQRTNSGRGLLGPGSAAPQGDLPPHLLAQHPSGKVALYTSPLTSAAAQPWRDVCA